MRVIHIGQRSCCWYFLVPTPLISNLEQFRLWDVKAECLLIKGTGCWVQVFFFIDSWQPIRGTSSRSVCRLLGSRHPGLKSCIQQTEKGNIFLIDPKTISLVSVLPKLPPTPGRSSKLTHTGVEIDTMCIPDRLSVAQSSHGHVIGVAFFWRDFSGVKRTCWTTGSWRSCLSLEIVSSIPAWSTIIYRFLCRFICVSLCQSIKIKPTNMYVRTSVCTYVRSYVRIYVCMYVQWPWADLPLQIGWMLADHVTSYQVESFVSSLIAQSVCQRAFSLLAVLSDVLSSNPALCGGTQLVSFRFEITSLCQCLQN